MSAYALSFAALLVARYTWWSLPPAQPVQVYEVPAQSAEFSCSARCPTPAPPVVSPAAPSSASPFFWIVASILLCALCAWCVWPRVPPTPPQLPTTFLTLPALPAGTRILEEHQEGALGSETESGVTPQRQKLRRIRALRDAAESGSRYSQDSEHL